MAASQILSAAEVNSVWLYLLYVLIVVFILVQATFYLIKSLRRAKRIKMDMAKIKKVVTSSALFTILPSVGIFIGVLTLAGSLGFPLPSIRLSVVGSLQYETMAADIVAQHVGEFSGLKAMLESMGRGIEPSVFVTFVFAMTFGIIWGPLFCLFFYKRLQPKMLSAAKKNDDFGKVVFAAVFIGMVLAYLSVAIGEIFYLVPGAKLPSGLAESVRANPKNIHSVYYGLIAVVASALTMWGLQALITKKNQKWLENFALSFSMIVGMLSVAGVHAIVMYA